MHTLYVNAGVINAVKHSPWGVTNWNMTRTAQPNDRLRLRDMYKKVRGVTVRITEVSRGPGFETYIIIRDRQNT